MGPTASSTPGQKILGQGVPQSCHRFFQVFHAGGEAQAHVPGGTEGRSGHQGNPGIAEQFLCQFDVGADPVGGFDGALEAGEHIEGTNIRASSDDVPR